MNVLKRCCMRSLKENRKRTVVTIVGVILATALITGVACLAESMRGSLIEYEKQVNGDYHYCFYGVDRENLKYFENNINIDKVSFIWEVGYAILEGSENPDKPYLYIRSLNQKDTDFIALNLTEGRMPENDSELVISRHIRYNGMVDLQVGDTLTLQIGNRMSDGFSLGQDVSYTYEEEALEPVREKTYTIVGVVERPVLTVEGRYAPGYSVFTLLDKESEETGKYEVYTTYTGHGLKNANQVTAGLLGISEELFEKRYIVGLSGYTEEEEAQVTRIASKVQENWALLRWLNMDFSDTVMGMLYGMAALAVFIIMLTSVFCIRNSFVISLTEKIKLYGRLASVGTTSKQQRKMVYYEAAFLCMVGIPIGIISGLVASVVLVRLVSGLMEMAMDIPLVFSVSPTAVILAIVLSVVTIFLSAMQSARQAARISPISAIRGNNSVKIGKREMKCPGLIGKMFGIGGRIAFRNLRRARRRYRTTVISIVVSVAVFIGLSTFTELLGMASGMYFETVPYQIQVNLYETDGSSYEKAQLIAGLEDVQQVEIMGGSRYDVLVDLAKVPFTDEYRKDYVKEYPVDTEFYGETIYLLTLGEKGYADYCRRVGVDVEKAKDKAIVVASDYDISRKNGVIYVKKEEFARYKSGDTLQLVNAATRGIITEPGDLKVDLEIIAQTEILPMCFTNTDFKRILVIVSNQWWENSPFTAYEDKTVQVYIRCRDAGKLEEIIRSELPLSHFTLNNLEAAYQEERSMSLVIAIFLYGFITVVALIGITNIFNTISTNMELRSPEFAMLRAVGMTGKEFRRMIWLEGLFYGSKALLIGIPLGLGISVAFHMIFSEGIVTTYHPPVFAIGLSVAIVVILLYGIMHYSMGKVNRKNIVETIQNENL